MNWVEERIKDTWRWGNLKWPSGLSASVDGQYRIYEEPQYGEQRFTPQWRMADGHSWQNWIRVTWGRCGSSEPVAFTTLHEAKAWLDEAHKNRPRVVAHQYKPIEEAA